MEVQLLHWRRRSWFCIFTSEIHGRRFLAFCCIISTHNYHLRGNDSCVTVLLDLLSMLFDKTSQQLKRGRCSMSWLPIWYDMWGEGLRVWWGRELQGWINHGRPPLWLNMCACVCVCPHLCVCDNLCCLREKTQFNQSADCGSKGTWYRISKKLWKADRNRKWQGMWRLSVCIY